MLWHGPLKALAIDSYSLPHLSSGPICALVEDFLISGSQRPSFLQAKLPLSLLVLWMPSKKANEHCIFFYIIWHELYNLLLVIFVFILIQKQMIAVSANCSKGHQGPHLWFTSHIHQLLGMKDRGSKKTQKTCTSRIFECGPSIPLHVSRVMST